MDFKILNVNRKPTVNNVSTFQKVKGLKCIYTNADTLVNKMNELRTRIANTDPDIIAITETKPKHAKYSITTPEITIDGYNIHHNSLNTDGTRGCALYVRASIKANHVEITTAHKDNIWLDINMIGNDKLLIGCVYRSPNSSQEDNNHLRELITKVTNMKYSHLLIMGDFNFPGINWATWSTRSQNEDDEEYQFLESLRDGFLFQHVLQPTRVRGENEPSTLDLLLTNEEGMVDEIELVSPLGKSDHGVLSFLFHCYNTELTDAPNKFLFNKGDYNKMEEELRKVVWEDVLKEEEDVDRQWTVFAGKVKEAMEKYIPRRKIQPGSKKRFVTPLDTNTIRKI